MTKLNRFRDQVLLVLNDYRGTIDSVCSKCHHGLTDEECKRRKCGSCGFDPLSFCRNEGVRLAAADRIIGCVKSRKLTEDSVVRALADLQGVEFEIPARRGGKIETLVGQDRRHSISRRVVENYKLVMAGG